MAQLAKPGPWSQKSRKKEDSDEAHIWGHKDPSWTIAHEPEHLESEMRKYLASFEDSHWRPACGSLIHTSYVAFPQGQKQVGMMILDYSQFNIIMDMNDPKANIEAMHTALRRHIMLCRDSDEHEIIYQTNKDKNPKVLKGEHASQWDILFRTVKLHSFKMGLTKNGDLSNLIGMGFHEGSL